MKARDAFQRGEKKMIRNITTRLLSITLFLLLVVATTPIEAGAQQPASTTYSGQGVPLTADELQALVAPIALYPDSLVAQILGASTFQTKLLLPSTGLARTVA
jgi:hypothetical protein